eukprot:747145-Hanusia_phi.AAC.1
MQQHRTIDDRPGPSQELGEVAACVCMLAVFRDVLLRYVMQRCCSKLGHSANSHTSLQHHLLEPPTIRISAAPVQAPQEPHPASQAPHVLARGSARPRGISATEDATVGERATGRRIR